MLQSLPPPCATGCSPQQGQLLLGPCVRLARQLLPPGLTVLLALLLKRVGGCTAPSYSNVELSQCSSLELLVRELFNGLPEGRWLLARCHLHLLPIVLAVEHGLVGSGYGQRGAGFAIGLGLSMQTLRMAWNKGQSCHSGTPLVGMRAVRLARGPLGCACRWSQAGVPGHTSVQSHLV